MIPDNPPIIEVKERRLSTASNTIGDIISLATLTIIVSFTYTILPKQGNIWNMDASRHALNGVFVLDFLRAMPLHHPMQFAYSYYRQWPALTIGFYPPLFYFILAGFYAVFGASEAVALLAETCFLLALGWGAYRLSRNWLAPPQALACALLLIGAPQVAYWGRQIMLDVPAYALIIWSAVFLFRYMKSPGRFDLHIAGLLAVAAVCTKYNAIFFTLIIVIATLYCGGRRALLDKSVWGAAVVSTLALIPVLAIFFVFSRYNLSQAESVAHAASRWSLAGLTFYARIMPSVVSWPTVSLACLYAIALPFAPKLRLPQRDAVVLLAWLVVGFLFYTMIAVKEPRHILFITYPIVLAAVLLIDRALAGLLVRRVLVLVLAASVLTVTLATQPPPFVTGNRQAAEVVAQQAPRETNVAFWGWLDGTFTFAMRAYVNRPDLGVIRLDKLLFRNLEVSFDRGFSQNVIPPADFAKLFLKYHVQYVVFQQRYHDDLVAVKNLEQALTSDKFKKVTEIPMSSNYPFHNVTKLIIYRLVQDVPKGRVEPPLQMMLLGRSI